MSETSEVKPQTSTDVQSQIKEERYLVFSLCKEQYAIPLLQVKEVIANNETTAVPYSPAHFKGVINLRGQVISIIDLRLKFNLSKAEYGPETSIIILDLAPLCIGVVVDSVDCVMAFMPSEMNSAPDVEAIIKNNYLTGVARKDKSLVLLLDIRSTLNVEDLQALRRQTEKAA